MRVGILFTLLLGMPEILRAPEDNFIQRVAAFEVAWVKFINRVAGCPEGRVLIDPASECSPATGIIDYRLYRLACLKASALYKFPTDVCRAE